MKELKQVIAELVKNGATRVNDLVVKSVTVKEHEDWAQVILKVNKDVKQNVQDEEGNYSRGTGRTVFISAFSVGAIFSDMPEVALFKKMIMNTPEALETILSYAKISIIQEEVAAGSEYVNPFSETNSTSMIEHDTILSHIASIELGEEGEDFIAMLRAEHRKAMIAKIMAGGKLAALTGKKRAFSKATSANDDAEVESNEEEA